MSIAWTKELAVGDPIVDADHRRMIELIALLESAAAGSVGCDRAGEALVELTSLCLEHFAREEALLARIGYPGREEHATGHAMLIKRLEAVSVHYDQGDDDVKAGIIRTLGDSLATWLLTHITTADMDFKPYVSPAS
ncbi:conserved hypothetical protein [Candidatus Terasakiella magnetica]|nr:conserved hypothetical protein [Candidatus Terasakiella magnetica]